MGWRGGTETNRAGVKRRGAEEKRVKRMREREHDNDRVSERGSVNERQTERDESMWNIKGDRHCHLSHCTSVSLTLPLSIFFHLSFYTARNFLLLFFKPSPSAHFLFSLLPPITNPHFLSLASTNSLSPPSFLLLLLIFF